MARHHRERHRTGRIGWLRAAVLGANDGIVSTASLMLGMAAAQATHSTVVVAGVAGLVAGAMSMAAGEYVSVQSQADTEQAELARERTELHADAQGEHEELMAIYVARGLDPALAHQVAEQLMAHDALGAQLIPVVSGSSLACLALLGGVAARVMVGALRVTFWGALAMGLTAGVGALFGTGA
jgi:VIT1/CCC1 family predicted Fe2+/Mn2+ transporter